MLASPPPPLTSLASSSSCEIFRTPSNTAQGIQNHSNTNNRNNNNSSNSNSSSSKSSHVRVVVRVRPLHETEDDKECLVVNAVNTTSMDVSNEGNSMNTGMENIQTPVDTTTTEENAVNNSIRTNILNTDTPTGTPIATSSAMSTPNSPSRRKRQSLIPSTRKSGLKTPTSRSLLGGNHHNYSSNNNNNNNRSALKPSHSSASKEQPLEQTTAPLPTSLSVQTSSATSSSSNHNNNSNHREFTFDGVFSPNTTQQQLYQQAVGDTVQQNVFKGYNTTILAYGQTGSGKTYTMMGNSNNNISEQQQGILPRAIADIFRAKQLYEPKWEITIALNCLELLQEEFRDLLLPGTTTTTANNNSNHNSNTIKLRNLGSEQGIVVEGTTHVQVHSVEQALELVRLAAARRATSATRRNEQSSRSHAIYSFLVSMKPREEEEDNDDSGSRTTAMMATSAKLTLVDLAGSEQIKKSGVQGQQAKESININKDLFVLGKVVSALAEKSCSQEQQAGTTNSGSASKKVHVPYRDSKLTQLLQDSLGGNCCTLLIACVSPAENQADESINTLRYAERSRSIANLVMRNSLRTVVLTATESDALRAENERLKAELAKLRRLQLQQTPVTPALEELQSKLELAEQQARQTRESCLTVAHFADKWRERCEFADATDVLLLAEKTESLTDSENSFLRLNPCDESLVGEENESLLNDDERSVSPKDNEEASTVSSPGVSKCTPLNKTDMAMELRNLSDEVEAKRSELETLNSKLNDSGALDSVKREVAKEERKRDELAKEVNRLKLKIHLLATDDASSSTPSLQSIFGSSSSIGDSSASNAEVEMKTIRSLYEEPPSRREQEAMTRIKELQEQLQAERERAEKQREEHQRQVDELTKENQRLLEENRQSAHSNRLRLLEEENERLQQEANRAKLSKKEAAENARKLREEVDSLRDACERLMAETREQRDVDSVADLESSSRLSSASSVLSAHQGRFHAAQILAAYGKAMSSECPSISSSCAITNSPEASSARVVGCSANENQVVISNMNQMTHPVRPCTCESADLFGKKEYVEFYLPKLGINCACGKKKVEVPSGSDPCALRNILRDWQTHFLAAINIVDTLDFIHASEQRPGVLAKEMKRWRKSKSMPMMKTQACAIALHIWTRTCKIVLRAVQEQANQGIAKPARPNFLDVCMISDSSSMSTLDMASVRVKA